VRRLGLAVFAFLLTVNLLASVGTITSCKMAVTAMTQLLLMVLMMMIH
jgi:hypothetical protein